MCSFLTQGGLLILIICFLYIYIYYLVIDLSPALRVAHGGHKIEGNTLIIATAGLQFLNLNMWLHYQIHACRHTCFTIVPIHTVLVSSLMFSTSFSIEVLFGFEYSVLESMVPV